MDDKGENYADRERPYAKWTIASNYELINVFTYDIKNPNSTDKKNVLIAGILLTISKEQKGCC